MHQDKTVKMVDLEKYYSLTHPHGNRAAGRAGGEGLCHARREPGGPTQQGDFADKKALAERETLEGIGASLESQLTQHLDEHERKQLVALLQKLLGIESSKYTSEERAMAKLTEPPRYT